MREKQTATSDVLRVISSSPGELEPVFQAMLENAVRICEAKFGSLYLREGDAFRVTAQHNAPPGFAEERRREPVLRPGPGTGLDRMVQTKRAVQIADVEVEPAYRSDARAIALIKLAGYRTALCVPMLKEDELQFAGRAGDDLSDSQLDQIMRLAAPLSVDDRAAFLERLASELRGLSELGDGVVFRTASRIQKEFFDPPDIIPHPGRYA